jgi:hypothetical protein
VFTGDVLLALVPLKVDDRYLVPFGELMDGGDEPVGIFLRRAGEITGCVRCS